MDASSGHVLPAVETSASSCRAKPSPECYKAHEDSSSQRSLSPVLNSNKSHRKLIYNRKRGRSKSRVKLTKRFTNSLNINTELDIIQSEIISDSCLGQDYFNKTLSDIQNFKSNQVGDRLAKLREFEKEKQKILGSLYITKEAKTYVSDRKSRLSNVGDEFNFKKPISPVSVKKFKPTVDVLSQDIKAIHQLGTNSSNNLLLRQDLNNSIESNQPNIQDIVINNNINVRGGNLECKGFCTGSGKNIIISPDRLRKNVALFGDILDINDFVPADERINSYSESHGKTCREENAYDQLKNDSTLSHESNDYMENEQTVETYVLHDRKEVSFMQTSISDSQLILAADVALSVMDNTALIAPSSTIKTVELEGCVARNDCDVVELSKNMGSFPKLAHQNNKGLNMQMNYKNNIAHTARVKSIFNKKQSVCNEEDNFKGFPINEYNFAQQLCIKQYNLIEILENMIKSRSLLIISKNKTEKFTALEPNQPASNNLQQTTDTKVFEGTGKHALSNICTISSKRFKFDCGTSSEELINEQKKMSQLEVVSLTSDNLTSTFREPKFDADFFDSDFKATSKKPIKILPCSVKRTRHMCEQVCPTKNQLDLIQTDIEENIQGNSNSLAEFTNGSRKWSKSEVVPVTSSNFISDFKSTMFGSIDDFPDCGFRTASKKPIKMLPSSIKKAQHMYEQICQTENPLDLVQTEAKENIEDSNTIISVQKPSKSELIPITVNNNTSAFQDFSNCGFKTASKKPINMLPSSMKKAQHMYEQICQTENPLDFIQTVMKENNKDSNILTNVQKKPLKSEIISLNSNNNISSFKEAKIDSITDFSDCGFKTASKKPIKMLPSSMKKAQHMYEQICQTENPLDLLQTEAKENIDDSNTIISVQKPSKSELIPVTVNNNTSALQDFSNCGFKTASKKPINMLPSSIKKAQHMYEQICQTENPLDFIQTVMKENNKDSNILTNVQKKPLKSEIISLNSNNNISSFKEAKIDSITDFSDCGFKTASKKPIKMLPSSMKKAQHMYEQICQTENPLDLLQTEAKENIEDSNTITSVQKPSKSELIPLTVNNNTSTFQDFSNCGFKTASKKPIKMLPSSLKKARSIFENINLTENLSECNEQNEELFFGKSTEVNSYEDVSTAGGKIVQISDKTWHGADLVSENEELSSTDHKKVVDNEILGFVLENNCNVISNSGLARIDTVCSQTNIQEGDSFSTCAAGFTTGSGMQIKISKSALQKGETLFADEELTSVKPYEVELADVGTLNMAPVLRNSGGDLHKSKKIYHEDHHLNQSNNESQHRRSFSESHHGSAVTKILNPTLNKHKSFSSPRSSPRSTKKRLGLSACKQIVISNDKLQKAKSILEEDLDGCQNGGSRNASLNTPVRLKQPEIHSSTPFKEAGAFKDSNFDPDKESKLIKPNALDNIDITPVKRPHCAENIVEMKNLVPEDENKSAIIIREQVEGDIIKRLEQFENEYEDLMHKMEVILERKKALQLQEQLIKNADDAHRRQKPGVLLVKKLSSQKISLKELCGNRKPGSVSVNEALHLDVPKKVLEVTSKNAKCVQFNSNWNINHNKYLSTICTTDGSVVIPNPNNFISLTEISSAFQAMLGVDPRLLPKEWISNHFKWIVWKLASMERNFPDLFPHCLSVENVVQQLKYRYDREIDKAERPALRKILEKDDVPQKRMVLCVSDIIEVSTNIFELELTDGWYSIQTLIDPPLCKQIIRNKIVIGTKLMVQCAEILNCDGCHPLDVPSNVRLKITYNCTRRAAWYSKLGYQRTVEPFPIPLRAVNSDGGVIAAIKMYVVRVYPLRYMEREAGKTVWRNKKAEDKRAEEWANAKMREMEMIHQKVQEDYEKEMSIVKKNVSDKIDCGNLLEITSPKLLYQMLESTNDPEGFKNMLSPSQIASAMDYRSNIYAHHQKEVADRIAKQVKNLKSSHREVTSVLKLRIVDGSESSRDSFIFNIWKPTEEHLQLLKEGSFFSVYNVIPKPNGDLTANSRTHFKPELPLSSINRIQRHIFPIEMVQHSVHKPLFNEYDTVGTVVQMHKDTNYQTLWLTDSTGRLLQVKILGGPEQCSLLDNLNRGHAIAVMNLIFCHPHDMFGRALANQCTVITGYPQHKFLQNGLSDHCSRLPKDLTLFLNDCDKKIEVCVANMHVTRNTLSFGSTSGSVADLLDDSSEDNTVIPSRLTTTDVAMSLIDTDQFF